MKNQGDDSRKKGRKIHRDIFNLASTKDNLLLSFMELAPKKPYKCSWWSGRWLGGEGNHLSTSSQPSVWRHRSALQVSKQRWSLCSGGNSRARGSAWAWFRVLSATNLKEPKTNGKLAAEAGARTGDRQG